MDASPDVLAETVRAKRVAVDNDLELLRVRLNQADPRRHIDMRRVATTGLPLVAGVAGLWLFMARRRRPQSLEQLLVQGVSDLYEAERRLLPALERMRAWASNRDLERALAHHRTETEGQIERLHRVFRSIGARRRRGSTSAIAGILSDGERLLTRSTNRDVRDAAIIAAAQRVEHFEIAAYGTVCSYADTLGFTYAGQLLRETLEEERITDQKLTQLAEQFVNPQAIRKPRRPQEARR